MTEKKYTAKQLRLTNEEIVEKFAIYGAEVDWVARRQQSSDRILEKIIAKNDRLEKRINEVEKTNKYLCITLICVTVIAGVLFYIIA